ncbi:MAG: hypothetical protein E6R04_04570 [Spirochaetes bacterium]|nr:MAG: hypothetical protein E6R04_04570 [Spirochaetota bacterium]
MGTANKSVTRDSVDSKALTLLRDDPYAYIRATHRPLPFSLRRVSATDKSRIKGGFAVSMAEYYAHKDAEDASGKVNFDEVPLRYGGNKDTGHPEDVEWRR